MVEVNSMRKHPFIETAELLEEMLSMDLRIRKLQRENLHRTFGVTITQDERRYMRDEAKRLRYLARVDEAN